MGIESFVGGVTAVLLMVFGSMSAAPQCSTSVLPGNIELPCDLEPGMRRIYDRSPTFRAQSERIAAAADHLRVTIQIDALIPSRCRAFTAIQRHGRQIRAVVHLPPSDDHSELLAHEFEHLLEQIEGLDLQSLARVKGSGVRELEYQVFESDRAQAAGKVVVAEVRRRPSSPAAD